MTRIQDPIYELDETHTRYDYPRVWPSADQLHIEFAILAAVNAVTALVTLLFIVTMLRSKKLRSKPFNLYLVFIAIPDFLTAFLCFITCALSAPGSQYYSEWMCGFQTVYLNFGFISNAWINALIIYQIHKMLRFSNIRRRFIPPTNREICYQATGVYCYALCWGVVTACNFDFLPHKSHLYYGFACSAMEYDFASALFFWLVYMPLFLVTPVAYACYVVYDVFTKKLMPPVGKRRDISIFLLRLCFLYFGVWFPFLLFSLVGNFVVIDPFVCWVGAAISHFQGCISVLFCLTNNDIRQSFCLLITCQTVNRADNDDVDGYLASGALSQDEVDARSRSLSGRLFRWSLRQSSSIPKTSTTISAVTEKKPVGSSLGPEQSRTQIYKDDDDDEDDEKKNKSTQRIDDGRQVECVERGAQLKVEEETVTRRQKGDGFEKEDRVTVSVHVAS